MNTVPQKKNQKQKKKHLSIRAIVDAISRISHDYFFFSLRIKTVLRSFNG